MYKFSKSAIGLLDNKVKLRFVLVHIVTSKIFENIVMVLILLNSILLGVKDYTDWDNVTPMNRFVENLEPFFFYCFIVECAFKILAMGFLFGHNTYLNEPWNWLDFIVVVTSLLEQLPGMDGVSGLRTFRLFRPLRSLTTMPSMKLLVGTLISSVGQLGSVMGLASFFFMIFAILGVSLLDGKTHWRCYQTPLPDPESGLWHLVEEDKRLCSADSRSCPKGYCGSRYEIFDSVHYKTGWGWDESKLGDETKIGELNFNITNFDNIGNAFLTIF